MEKMFVNLLAKVLHDGLNRRGQNLAQTADGTQPQGLGKFFHDLLVRFMMPSLRPAMKNLNHLLRSYSAGHALSTRLVAIKTYRIERHVQHASAFGAHYDGGGAHHGFGF